MGCRPMSHWFLLRQGMLPRARSTGRGKPNTQIGGRDKGVQGVSPTSTESAVHAKNRAIKGKGNFKFVPSTCRTPVLNNSMGQSWYNPLHYATVKFKNYSSSMPAVFTAAISAATDSRASLRSLMRWRRSLSTVLAHSQFKDPLSAIVRHKMNHRMRIYCCKD